MKLSSHSHFEVATLQLSRGLLKSALKNNSVRLWLGFLLGLGTLQFILFFIISYI